MLKTLKVKSSKKIVLKITMSMTGVENIVADVIGRMVLNMVTRGPKGPIILPN